LTIVSIAKTMLRASCLALCAAAAAASAHASAGAGASNVLGFVLADNRRGITLSEVDATTGAVTALGPAVDGEFVWYGLSAADHTHGIIYTVGRNATGSNLFGLDATSGKVVVSMALPFTMPSGQLVGVGQGVDVDPATGDVFVTGQMASEAMHHEVFRVDFASKAMTSVAKLVADDAKTGGSANIQGCTLDYKKMIEYVILPVQPAGGGGVEIHLFAVELKTGKVTHTPMDQNKGTMINPIDYDGATGKIFGFGPPKFTVAAHNARYGAGSSRFASVQEWRDLMSGAGPAIYEPLGDSGLNQSSIPPFVHTLASLDPETLKATVVGEFPGYFVVKVQIAGLDEKNRVHLSMMQPTQPPVQGWVPATNCANPSCGAGTLCCRDPAQGEGACYKVGACSDIHDGSGLNTTAPFNLVQMDLDTFTLLPSPPITPGCALQGSGCPISLNVA
jgi:hypothetical protein